MAGKQKRGGAPLGNRNASGKHSGAGRTFMKIPVYSLSNSSEKLSFQARFPSATDAFLKRYSSKAKK